MFIVARRRFGTSFGTIFMSQTSYKYYVQMKDRLLCGEKLRVVVFPLVVKGHKHSFIDDTDTLVLTFGQFNLSQNRKLSLHTKSQFV